jgi:hypothetical protein
LQNPRDGIVVLCSIHKLELAFFIAGFRDLGGFSAIFSRVSCYKKNYSKVFTNKRRCHPCFGTVPAKVDIYPIRPHLRTMVALCSSWAHLLALIFPSVSLGAVPALEMMFVYEVEIGQRLQAENG